MHSLTKNLLLEPTGWRNIAAYKVVQRHGKKDFYVQNYTFLLYAKCVDLRPP
jgi:hypothetical protein